VHGAEAQGHGGDAREGAAGHRQQAEETAVKER
jgi:hypothetical protein